MLLPQVVARRFSTLRMTRITLTLDDFLLESAKVSVGKDVAVQTTTFSPISQTIIILLFLTFFYDIGDCDADSDCQGPLKCYQRGSKQAVPGCTGGAQRNDAKDFCYMVRIFSERVRTYCIRKQ